MIQAVKIHKLATEKAELTILKALAYFDIFNYPLTEGEIRNFLNEHVDREKFRSAMHKLLFAKTVFRFQEFYCLRNDITLVEQRLLGNRRARKLLPKASRIGAFLFQFPYVRAVGVSGSLSKNFADKKADIDFFIITKSNRLWIARTLLHVFKKFTFLLGRQHFYCMNYFIDEAALLISDQNIYSATEVVTVFPVAGKKTINLFFDENKWTDEWLPVYQRREVIRKDKNSFLKRSLERFFDGGMGEKLDNFLFHWTTRRWQTKERLGHRNLKGKIMNLVTDKHFSKSDPEAFQARIVTMYENKIEQFRTRWPQYFS